MRRSRLLQKLDEGIKPRPIIFSYRDYRVFLSDFIKHLKSIKAKKITAQNIAKGAGFKSHSTLTLVIQGKRNLASDYIVALSKALQLNKEEAKFFLHLVLLNQAKGAEEKQIHAHQITLSRNYRKYHPFQKEQLQVLSKWYYLAVRELVGMPDFQEDPEWIAHQIRPAITAAEAQSALKNLQRIGMLERNELGKLVQSQKIIRSDDELYDAVVPAYHKAMIEKAQEAVDRFDRTERLLSSVTLGISEKSLKALWDMIHRFRRETLAFSESVDHPNAVYQVNFQLFPLTASKEQKKKD